MAMETILIVEDERIVARDLQATLHQLGYIVAALAANGADAIAKAKSLRPDLVLMDIRLQGTMDGIEAASIILTELDIPVIYLTAFVDAATRLRARQTAPYGYLVKPFDERTVQTTIEMALERHARDRQSRAREQQNLRTQDQRQIERLRVLAGGIAHDFNNILAAVLGNAELLRLDLPEEHTATEALGQIAHSVHRASNITHQLRSYAGNAPLLLEPLDLTLLVHQAVTSLPGSTLAPATISMQLAPDLPCVEADAVQMHMVVLHLLTNAAEAIETTGGNITIITELRQVVGADLASAVTGADLPGGEYVAIEVADTGCGMDEALLAQIFDPFFTTKFTGRGLGLPAVLGIVRQHGGAILVRGAPGQGATFTILLPPCRRGVGTV